MPVQTLPDTHPAYCTLDTRSFLGVKQPGHGAEHASTSRAKVVNGLELYLCLPPCAFIDVSWGDLYIIMPVTSCLLGHFVHVSDF